MHHQFIIIIITFDFALVCKR